MPLASPKYPFKEAVIDAVPEDAGIYALYFDEHLMYIGMAPGTRPDQTLRARLQAHVLGEVKPTVATHYQWEITRHPELRLAELLRMLERKLPPYNAPGV